MKPGLTVFLLIQLVAFCGASYAQKQDDALSRMIALEATTTTVEAYFAMIGKQGITLSYNPGSLPLKTVVSVAASSIRAGDLLTAILPPGTRLVARGSKIIIAEQSRQFSISGFIKEDVSEETLPGATISVVGQPVPKGAVSNESGFFSLSLPAGDHTLRIGYIGFESLSVRVSPEKDEQLTIHLKPAPHLLAEAEVKAEAGRNNVEYKIDPMGPASQSSVFFNSVMNNLQFLPGIVANPLLASKIQVRGGNTNENLIVIDGIPVYNYSHVGSVLSIFNSDAIKSFTFYKGGFPARYEGRLSSVMDIQMKDGDKQNHHGAFSLDLLSASAMLEGPIERERSSYLLSFRRSWFDLGNALPKNALWFYVYDFNMKLHFELNKKKQLLISAYKGADTFRSDLGDKNQALLRWTNFLASVQLKQVVSPVLFNRTVVAYSRYLTFITPDDPDGAMSERHSNQIDDVSLSTDFDCYPSDFFTVRFGAKTSFVQFTSQSVPEGYSGTDLEKQRQSTIQASAYLESDLHVNDKLSLGLGVNALVYMPSRNKTLPSVQPRVQLKYLYRPDLLLFASFSTMAQFYHQLTINGFSLPFELRVPSIDPLKPSKARTLEAGYKYHFDGNKGLLSTSVYYGRRKSILTMRPQQDFQGGVVALDWKDRITVGKGESVGVEFLVKREWKRFWVQAAYTWSASREQYEVINNGRSIRSAYDVPHLLNGIISFKLSQSSLLTTSFNAQSGMLVAAPRYSVPSIDEVLGATGGSDSNNYILDGYYQYRLPFNVHINLGYSYTWRDDKGRDRLVLRCGLYNLAGNHQPFSYDISIEDLNALVNTTSPGKFIPYAGFSFKF